MRLRRLSLLASDLIKMILISIYHEYRFSFSFQTYFYSTFLGHNNSNMAQKVSINKRFSKIQSNSISFKNKRRRKLHTESSRAVKTTQYNLLKTNKSPKHRWKLNGNGSDKSISDERCMTNARDRFQESFSYNNSPHEARKVDRKFNQNDGEAVKSRVNNLCHFITKAKSFSCGQARVRDESSSKKCKPLRRDFVNCRQLLNWSTASSVRKLLPIFILVNMLPFLYAGESS